MNSNPGTDSGAGENPFGAPPKEEEAPAAPAAEPEKK